MASKKMALIATKGTLDMAYPPFILASTAAALGWEVQIFFTFYGLQLLRKSMDDIKISPLANPAMPMPVPMPVMVQMLPGMESMATMMMKAKMKSKGVASLQELHEICQESDVKFIACQMTVDRRLQTHRLHRRARIRWRCHLHEIRRRERRVPVHLSRPAAALTPGHPEPWLVTSAARHG